VQEIASLVAQNPILSFQIFLGLRADFAVESWAVVNSAWAVVMGVPSMRPVARFGQCFD
jgi:hypothetical protein